MTEVTRQTYVGQVRRWLPAALERYDEQTAQWRATLGQPSAFGEVSTPGHPVAVALAEAFLAVEDGDQELARRAAQRMVTLRQFADEIPRSAIPDHAIYRGHPGVPPQANYFILPWLCEGYAMVRRWPGLFCAADHEALQGIIADSVEPLFHFPEWGSHNRTMLRAWTLAAAAAVCPDRPERARWVQMARQLAADTVIGWTVEDASSYHPIWSRATMAYVEQAGEAHYYRQPTARYYFEYYLNLLCPIGGIADFGDGDWAANSQLYLTVFEGAARAYGDGCFRWAAQELYHRLAAAADTDTFGDPANWIHCARWVDDGVAPVAPDWGSREVLEELAGKKVVFRSGWSRDATFLMLNYKPETDYGRTIRQYMKNTISVEAEKAHHGHSDENAITTLVSGGVLLLHDGGYRESLPNGKYRADYYHARPVVRRALLRAGEPVYTFLRDDGHHRPMVTERIDFHTFAEVEFSRTRARDPRAGYEHDRVVAFIKDLDLFLVIDAVTFLAEGPYSVCSLFFTHEVLAEGDGWFATRLGAMRHYSPPVDRDRRLLVAFAPRTGAWQGREPVRRYFQDEILLHQSIAGRGAAGRREVFLAALVPHAPGADPAALAAGLSAAPVSRPGSAFAAVVRRGDDEVTVGVKLDLEDAVLFDDVRPRYDWDSGRTRYGAWETDAHFLYGRRRGARVSWAWTEATRLELDGRELFQAEQGTFPLQYAGPGTRHAVSKWRAWQSAPT